MTYLIVKGGNSKGTSRNSSKYQGFYPHWNRALEKNPVWVGTRRQYDYELKSRGLEVYDKERPVEPSRKPYIVKESTHGIISAIKDQTNKKTGEFTPSTSLQTELIKRKVIRKMSEVQKMKEYTNNA